MAISGPVSPTYVLEHLATFTVSPENDLVYPADGMRRLLAMEKTNGIWTQKMLMKIERNMIIIMDHENKVTPSNFTPSHGQTRGARYLMGEYLKVVWAEFSTIS